MLINVKKTIQGAQGFVQNYNDLIYMVKGIKNSQSFDENSVMY